MSHIDFLPLHFMSKFPLIYLSMSFFTDLSLLGDGFDGDIGDCEYMIYCFISLFQCKIKRLFLCKFVHDLFASSTARPAGEAA